MSRPTRLEAIGMTREDVAKDSYIDNFSLKQMPSLRGMIPDEGLKLTGGKLVVKGEWDGADRRFGAVVTIDPKSGTGTMRGWDAGAGALAEGDLDKKSVAAFLNGLSKKIGNGTLAATSAASAAVQRALVAAR